MRLVAEESGVTRLLLSSFSPRMPHPELIVREIKRNYANIPLPHTHYEKIDWDFL